MKEVRKETEKEGREQKRGNNYHFSSKHINAIVLPKDVATS